MGGPLAIGAHHEQLPHFGPQHEAPPLQLRRDALDAVPRVGTDLHVRNVGFLNNITCVGVTDVAVMQGIASKEDLCKLLHEYSQSSIKSRSKLLCLASWYSMRIGCSVTPGPSVTACPASGGVALGR